MQSKIVKFLCPACSQELEEERYYEACEEIKGLATRIAKNNIKEHFVELEIGYLRDTKRKNERVDHRVKEPKTTVLEDET